MAGEIAYKLTADEKQALDAILKVARAYSDVEGGAKGATEATKRASRETEEMGRLAKRVMEDAKAPAQKYAEQVAKLDQLYKDGRISLGAYENAVKNAQGSMGDAFGSKALGMVKTLAGAFGAGSVLFTAVNAIKGEFQSIIELQDRVKTATLGVADAEAAALRNLGPASEEDVKKYLTSVERTSKASGVSEKNINVMASEALSARGDLPVSAAMSAVEAGAIMAPDSPETAKGLAGGALDILKAVPDITAKQAVGFLMKVTEKARITDAGDVARSLAPVLTADMASGGNEEFSAAVFSALTQATADPHGRRTKTAGIQFLTQLAKFMPEKGDVYSEEAFQHEKRVLAQEKAAKEQAMQHAVRNDPEYLRKIEQIETEKASLPHLKRRADPALHAVQDLKRREFADQERKALEEAQARVAASPEFATMEEDFAVKAKALEERRTRAKTIIVTGLKSNEARVRYLQAHPEAGKQFLEQASFEAVAQIPAEQIVTGRGRTNEMVETMMPDIGRAKDAGPAFDRNVRLRMISPRQQTADFVRRLDTAVEGIESAPEMQIQARIGALMEKYGPLLKDVGEYATVAKLKEIGVRLSGDEFQTARSQLLDRQRKLRTGHRKLDYQGIGEPRLGFDFPDSASTDVPPTQKELAQAERLQTLIDLLGVVAETNNKLNETLNAHKETLNANTQAIQSKQTYRPTLAHPGQKN